MRRNKKQNINTYIILAIIIVVSCAVYLAQDVLSDMRGKEPIPEESIVIHMIDVGQGDAIFIDNGSKDILIDTGSGNAEDKLLEYLDALEVKNIEYLFLTHPHEDHIGNADEVLWQYKVKNVVMPDAYENTACYRKLMEAIDYTAPELTYGCEGDSYEIGDSRIKVFSPYEDMPWESANYVSLIMRLSYGDVDCMFTGDAEIENEEYVLNHYRKELDCDLLKVGHHGSSTSSCGQFLAAVSPDIAIISVGEGNQYGHPHRETISALGYYTDEVYRTDLDGDIVLVCDGEDIWYHK